MSKTNEGCLHENVALTNHADIFKRRIIISERLLPGLVMVSDTAQWLVSGLVIYGAYWGFGAGTGVQYATVALVAAVVTVALFHWAGLYSVQAFSSWPGNIPRCVVLSAISVALLTVIAFALKISDQFSRVWFFGSWFTATALICASRCLYLTLTAKWAEKGILDRRIAIIGAQEQTRRLLLQLERSYCHWQRVVGIFDDRKTRIEPEVSGYGVRGDRNELEHFVRAGQVDDVLIALPWSAEDRIAEIVEALRPLPTSIFLCSDLIGYRYDQCGGSSVGLPVREISAAPLSGWNGVLKSTLDKILVVALLALLAPFMLLIALAIKLDSRGPVFFYQERYGFNNERIRICKFRTMYLDSDRETGFIQATRGDERVTFVGRFLRKTSLDELPQLLNVLVGEMSLVGPRPHPVELNQRFEALIGDYHSRHRVKPGITGWAQVNGHRGETGTTESMQRRVDHDIHYIENWSVWLDFRILLRTAVVVLVDRNAY